MGGQIIQTKTKQKMNLNYKLLSYYLLLETPPARKKGKKRGYLVEELASMENRWNKLIKDDNIHHNELF